MASLLTGGLLVGGCDLPTEGPSFQVETEIEAPILTRTTFKVLGRSDAETQVLIDTTRNSWDTLFAAAPEDNAVRLVQEIDALQFGSLDEVIPAPTLGSASFSFDAQDFTGVGKRARVGAAAQGITVSSEGAISLDLPHVSFESSEDYVELRDGNLVIEEISNSFNIDLASLVLTFEELREPPYEAGDGLTIRFEGSTTNEETHTYPALEANSTRGPITIDVSDTRLMPQDGDLDYRVEVTVNEVPSSDGEVSGTLGAEELSIGRIQAVLDPVWVDLTDDADGDGRLEVNRDAEAQITEIEGLKDISDVLESLDVRGAALDVRLGTNLAFGTEIYLALRGMSESEDVYLTGRESLAVSSARTDELSLYGTPGKLGPDRLIRLPIPESESVTTVRSRTVDLRIGPENSNADDLLNALPHELRLAGQALVNPSGPQRVALERPLEVTADVEAQLPIKSTGELVTITDRRQVDFSDIDALSDTSGTRIESGKLRLLYTNGLPLEGRLSVTVLDENDEPIGVEFGSAEEPIVLRSARTQNGLATEPVKGEASVELSAEEIDRLHEGRSLDIELTVDAGSASEPVRLQADDEIDVAVRGSFKLKVKTDGGS